MKNEKHAGERDGKVKYLYAFQDAVNKLFPTDEHRNAFYAKYGTTGLWTSAHMYYGQRVPYTEGAQAFFNKVVQPKLTDKGVR